MQILLLHVIRIPQERFYINPKVTHLKAHSNVYVIPASTSCTNMCKYRKQQSLNNTNFKYCGWMKYLLDQNIFSE